MNDIASKAVELDSPWDMTYGTIDENWSPQRVELIYWDLNTSGGTCSVNSSSVCYAMSEVIANYDLNNGYTPVYNLAAAVSAALSGGPALADMTPSPLPQNPDPSPQPWDFAVDQSCYVVFALIPSPGALWSFQPGKVALDFKIDETGYYADLWHVSPSGPTTTAQSGCTVCYFSAYVDALQTWGSDRFDIYHQFWISTILHQVKFDPAIKNKGHIGMMGLGKTNGKSRHKAKREGRREIHVPTRFEVAEYSQDAVQKTREKLEEQATKRARLEEALRAAHR